MDLENFGVEGESAPDLFSSDNDNHSETIDFVIGSEKEENDF